MNPNFSPADSLLSAPDDHGRSLFGNDSMMSASPSMSAMTPQSLDDCDQDSSASPQPEQGKRTTKKRKSWGQELPTPKTNLPPRKRAKTEDEKEQRRIERVLRNRAAAQSSRERKRKEVEGLESEKDQIVRHNNLLVGRLREVEMENSQLSQQIAKMAAEMTVFRKMMQGNLPSPEEKPRAISPTLSTGLYSHKETVPNLKEEFDELNFSLPPPQSHVDPRDADFHSASGSPKATPTSTTPNMTQHPAEMLCGLQCQLGASRSGERSSAAAPSPANQQRASLILFTTVAHLLLATAASTASFVLAQPLAEIFHSLKTGSPLSAATMASANLFPLILWLISTPINPLSTSSTAATTTSTTSSTAARSPSDPRPTFRITLLRRLLACSPALARPLRDATGQALRLMSSGELIEDVGSTGVDGSALSGRLRAESLLTMMWAIDSIEKARDKTVTVNRVIDLPPPSALPRHRPSLHELFDDDGSQEVS
ncbi:MAG: hypothetical protein M4579_005716 [Chaenotheca gracillima]|nr:MAG: hypothetical protein M4579_005716 [Chaenotheca gracillima]